MHSVKYLNKYRESRLTGKILIHNLIQCLSGLKKKFFTYFLYTKMKQSLQKQWSVIDKNFSKYQTIEKNLSIVNKRN